jgi:hypothetical protein
MNGNLEIAAKQQSPLEIVGRYGSERKDVFAYS